MHFLVAQDVYDIGIVQPTAAVISGLEVLDPTPPFLIEEGERIAQQIKQQLAAHLQKPEVIGFRQIFSAMGYEDLEPAGERLARTFCDRGFKTINSLVDACNISALEAICGLGVHDIRGRRDQIHLRRASGNETITPIFKDRPKKVIQGDIIYGIESNLMAWLGRRDVDAEAFRVSARTSEIVIVALGNKYTTKSYNETILKNCFARIQSCSPRAVMTMLDTIHP